MDQFEAIAPAFTTSTVMGDRENDYFIGANTVVNAKRKCLME